MLQLAHSHKRAHRRPYKRTLRCSCGTVLLMFPASVIVILVLAAIVVDFGLIRVQTQQLKDVAASAANDALGALDVDALRSTGIITFNHNTAHKLVNNTVRSGPLPDSNVKSVRITQTDEELWEIAVTLESSFKFVFTPALPGRHHTHRVTVTERVLTVL